VVEDLVDHILTEMYLAAVLEVVAVDKVEEVALKVVVDQQLLLAKEITEVIQSMVELQVVELQAEAAEQVL
jgi:hypothetical protein